MKPYINTLPFLFSAIFLGLFYHELLGVNVLVFELLIISTSFLLRKPEKRNPHAYVVLAGTVISAVFVVLYGSTISKAVNIFSFFFFLGYRCDMELRSPLYSLANACLYLLRIPRIAVGKLLVGRQKTRRLLARSGFYCRIILAPLLILLSFVGIYAAANSRFAAMLGKFSDMWLRAWQHILKYLDFSMLGMLVLGFFISAAYMLHTGQKSFSALDRRSGDRLQRQKTKLHRKGSFKIMDLKKEYQAMLFLLIAMNLLIAILNVIDIDWIWINFTWEGTDRGAELKQFVHAGTCLLIIAVTLSVSIAMYIFRGSMNFYMRNKWIKLLSCLWLFQNAVMLASVGMRTYRYVQYFNLAHKRIGLLFFLAAMLVLIIILIIKIRHVKSSYFLVRTSSLGFYIVFFSLCTVNWDPVIAGYNFRHAGTALLHKDWMITLSDKTLPVIRENLSLMDGSINSESWHYGNYATYRDLLEAREKKFFGEYAKRGMLSWNYADAKAFRQMQKQRGGNAALRKSGSVTMR